ncbi:alpha-L-arabinofuranosidase C-terminal domain-containing protein [Acidisarcina polymorpha]|uniref:alpha-L-arabinofuranosidase C-terminal domain-containing protein n=1 Tax=Acidisarcina polymorpha TaxID=2211140 RepID=UPI001374C700|nr:alpha-L-arabinofuranosidase C-terminal domain-containing protein [Acidisarcina polymorpha]
MIRVSRLNKPQDIPFSLFGSFLEPIGHSTYGGLWANVVENPSFEEGLWSAENLETLWNSRAELRAASSFGLPAPWEPLYPAQGSRYAPMRGDAANSAQSLLLMSLPDKEVGVLQRVYLPVHRELGYSGSLWLKHIKGNQSVKLSLRRHAHPGEVLAASIVQAPSYAWSKYAFHLELNRGQLAPLEPSDLVISLEGDARVLVDNVVLNPDDAVDGMDPEVLTLARELHSPVVRFGGNFTSAYNWRDGVGPPDTRVSKLNLAWGIPEYNTFGTDEFLRFCEFIQAKPQIALNLGTGSPRESASWVDYVNTRWADHRGGLTWELGNELWGAYQVGYPAATLAAAATLANSEAVRKVDPTARLIATGGDGGLFQDWNARQLTNPVDSFDYLSSHFIVNEDVLLPQASNDFRTMAMIAVPWGLSERIHEMKQQAIDAHRPKMQFAFTEWLMIANRSHSVPNYDNMGGALFAAGFLNTMMRNSDAVSIANMTGILEFGGIWKKREQVYASPAYWVLRAYARAKPTTLLKVESTSPTFNISKGVTQLPEIIAAPYLDVVAALSENGSSLLLLCVNRHVTRPESATIDFSSIGAESGPTQVTTIAGDGVLAENDEYSPNRVTAVTRSERLEARGSYTFPSASVTVIEIELKK